MGKNRFHEPGVSSCDLHVVQHASVKYGLLSVLGSALHSSAAPLPPSVDESAPLVAHEGSSVGPYSYIPHSSGMLKHITIFQCHRHAASRVLWYANISVMNVDANIELPLAWITTVYARLQAAGLHGANTLTSMACRAPDCPTAYKRQCLRKLERFPRQPARVLFHCARLICGTRKNPRNPRTVD